MQTPTRLATIIVAFLATLPLYAGVVEHDFLTTGDGLLTYDDVNQREWLDLTYTSGVDLTSVLSLTSPGEVLTGFNFSTLQDIEGLASSAGVAWLDREYSATSMATDDNAETLHYLLGNVLTIEFSFGNETQNDTSFIAHRYSFGQIANEIIDSSPVFDGGNVYVVYLDVPNQGVVTSENGGPFGGIATDLPLGDFSLATGDIGPFWLYRTAIPEPTSIALLIVATLATLSSRNRHC